MLSELFGLLDSVDVAAKGASKKFSVNLNKNRIRSISAFSSNSIFYFPTIVTDQATPEEVAMVSRMTERACASFVVACISLMPFHRIKADDKASIEDYLAQFHQNLGMNPGSGPVVNKLFGFVNSIEESAMEAEDNITDEDEKKHLEDVQNFMQECWNLSRLTNTDFISIVSETVSINDMFNEDAIDPMTRLVQQRYRSAQEELATWGFIGEATENMFDLDADDLLNMSDEDILNDEDYDEDEDLEDAEIPGFTDAMLDEGGNVKSAIDSIMFSLESVSENKILSCNSLTKLNGLESRLNKIKNKYTKYLNRYKKKYKENQESGSKSKLQIRFNNVMISDPKAFMKQYGKYIKITNKRLKLVEKRRQQLRDRKGLPTPDKNSEPKLEENVITDITQLDYDTLDHVISVMEAALNAPDSEIFTVIMDESAGILNEDWLSNKQADLTQALARRDGKKAAVIQREINDYIAMQNTPVTGGGSSRASSVPLGQTPPRPQTNPGGQQKPQNNPSSTPPAGQSTSGGGRMTRNAANQANSRVNNAKQTNQSARNAANRPNPYGKSGEGYDQLGDGYGRPGSAPIAGRALRNAGGRGASFKVFDGPVFTDMDMKKANEAIPLFTKATIGFIVDETEEVVSRDVLVGIKAYIHRAPSMELVNDIYNCIINKRKFLRFVKFITGEERSLADLLFGFRELKADAMDAKSKSGQWRSAFKRRKRWAKMSIPYLMKEYTPNGTIVMTMNEVNYIKDTYGVDIMQPDHVRMIMDSDFLLSFVVIDQAEEMVYVTYDGHGYGFQQFTYAMLERENSNASNERFFKEIYRSMMR